MHHSKVKQILAATAWDLLKSDDAVLFDVRTSAEWHYVGVPDLQTLGKKPYFLEWRTLPDLCINHAFYDEIKKVEKITHDTHLIFLCRTGGRSMEASMHMLSAGYNNCYNIDFGFEGELDIHNHRGNISGWKASGLPWRQD